MVGIADGSDLAPLMSVLEDTRKNRVQRPCTFLFSARTPKDLYCLEQIRQLEQGWATPFTFMQVLSHEPADSDWVGARGLVAQLITDVMPDIDWSAAEGYMCGPQGMIDAAMAAMTEVGMAIDKIFYDKFTDESHISNMP